MNNLDDLPQGPQGDDAWMTQAACKGRGPEVWHPGPNHPTALNKAIAAAKAVCAVCPVRADCLTYSLVNRMPHGIWGGLTEKERRAAYGKPRRKRTAA